MDTKFMNSKNSKTCDLHKLLLIFQKKNKYRSNKYVGLSNYSITYTWKNIKKLTELTDGSYSVSDIQDYFKYKIETHLKLRQGTIFSF